MIKFSKTIEKASQIKIDMMNKEPDYDVEIYQAFSREDCDDFHIKYFEIYGKCLRANCNYVISNETE